MPSADDGGSSTPRASGPGSASSPRQPQSVIGGPSNFDVEFGQEEEDQESFIDALDASMPNAQTPIEVIFYLNPCITVTLTLTLTLTLTSTAALKQIICLLLRCRSIHL